MAPILPGLTDRPEQLAEVVRAARDGRRDGRLGEPPLPQARHEGALPRSARARLAGAAASGTSGSTRSAPTCRTQETEPVRSEVRELAREHGVRDRRRVRLEPPPEPVQLAIARCDEPMSPRYDLVPRCPTRSLPDRRRPRGRARRPAPLALARAAHPRDRRGLRRRQRRRARRAPPAERRDHGRPHAGHGRARGDEAVLTEKVPDTAVLIFTAYSERSPAQPRARVGREGLHPQGGAARDARCARSRRSPAARASSTPR